jgi:hypothetical protein
MSSCDRLCLDRKPFFSADCPSCCLFKNIRLGLIKLRAVVFALPVGGTMLLREEENPKPLFSEEFYQPNRLSMP